MILSDGTDLVTLPDNEFWWSDEFDWEPLAQSVDITVDGSAVIEEFEVEVIRPITLVPLSDRHGWLLRLNWLILHGWRRSPGKIMSLTMADSAVYSVMFGRPALEQVEPIFPGARRNANEWWRGIIRLVKV